MAGGGEQGEKKLVAREQRRLFYASPRGRGGVIKKDLEMKPKLLTLVGEPHGPRLVQSDRGLEACRD